MILVVDDEVVIRHLLTDVLSGEGHTVRTAEHGFDGLQHLRRQAFDLVISDTHMPVMDGPAFIREVRHVDPAMPVIILDSIPDNDADPAGCDGLTAHIGKPFDLDQIRSTVARLRRPGPRHNRRNHSN